MKKFLLAILSLAALQPLFLALTIFFTMPTAMNMIKVSNTPDTSKMGMIIALCMIAIVAIYAVSIYLIWKNDPAGLLIAKMIGAVDIFSGLVFFFAMNDMSLAAPDFIKGALILWLALSTKFSSETNSEIRTAQA